ncbi:EthD family reductase [Catenulispora rubra]|uniref:EthD family reductase n=1 Tax=Catenulispora rubra TaxID=280293 RepID=UPI00189243CB|nr:EthD family reductase [Catenulispora rubra]
MTVPHTVVFATRRKAGLTREEFAEHYRSVHAPLARRLPGLLEYRQTLLRADYQWHGQRCEYDAISVYVFESDEAAEAAWTSPEGVAVDDDTGLFIDWDTVIAYPGTVTDIYRPM